MSPPKTCVNKLTANPIVESRDRSFSTPASPAAWCHCTATPSLREASISPVSCTSARSFSEVRQHLTLHLPVFTWPFRHLEPSSETRHSDMFLRPTDSFDGVSASQFRDGWLMRAGDQDIPGPVSFLNVTAYKATVLHGATLQGVDLARLFSATFLTSQPVTLRATLTFRTYLPPPPPPSLQPSLLP